MDFCKAGDGNLRHSSGWRAAADDKAVSHLYLNYYKRTGCAVTVIKKHP